MDFIAEPLQGLALELRRVSSAEARRGSPLSRSTVDRTLGGEWGDRPLLDAYSLARLNAGHTADHLLGAAACASAQNVVYSTLSLIRPALESAAHAYYLLDADIDTRERVGRWANVQLRSRYEVIKVDIPNAMSHDKARAEIAEIYRTATRYRYELSEGPRRRSGNPATISERYLRPKMPSIMRLVNDLLSDGPDASTGMNTYRLLSAVTHAQEHGLMALVLVGETRDSPVPGMSRVSIGINGQKLAGWLGSAVLAGHAVGQQLVHLLGLSVDEWNAKTLPILAQWRTWLRQGS